MREGILLESEAREADLSDEAQKALICLCCNCCRQHKPHGSRAGKATVSEIAWTVSSTNYLDIPYFFLISGIRLRVLLIISSLFQMKVTLSCATNAFDHFE